MYMLHMRYTYTQIYIYMLDRCAKHQMRAEDLDPLQVSYRVLQNATETNSSSRDDSW